MVAEDGTPFVLEYNCRFGDPETQPIMMRLESDLPALCLSAIQGSLSDQTAQWTEKAAVGVVLAAGGYPFDYNKGDVIAGIDDANRTGAKVFHAGTALSEDTTVTTNGGRVLCVTALGDSVEAAQQAAYQGVEKITWENVYFRTDIGHKAINR
jgi:phosphoribosylamine--glycine ligase